MYLLLGFYLLKGNLLGVLLETWKHCSMTALKRLPQ